MSICYLLLGPAACQTNILSNLIMLWFCLTAKVSFSGKSIVISNVLPGAWSPLLQQQMRLIEYEQIIKNLKMFQIALAVTILYRASLIFLCKKNSTFKPHFNNDAPGQFEGLTSWRILTLWMTDLWKTLTCSFHEVNSSQVYLYRLVSQSCLSSHYGWTAAEAL